MQIILINAELLFRYSEDQVIAMMSIILSLAAPGFVIPTTPIAPNDNQVSLVTARCLVKDAAQPHGTPFINMDYL